MKQLWILLLLILMATLTGCSDILASEYTEVTPHSEQNVTESDEDVLTAANYLSLENAIRSFVQNGAPRGVIRIYDYSGDIEADLETAAHEISENDPLGAYAVEDIDYELTQIVAYHEANISITFRRTSEQIDSIVRVAGNVALADQINGAMKQYASELVMRLSYFNDQDCAEFARQYYQSHPLTAMQMPQITVHIYPEYGNVRTIEMLFRYEQSAQELQAMQEAVATSVHAAGEYVRYRETESGKLQLLYTYMMERFTYELKSMPTPVYSFLCDGIADAEGCAKSLQIICDQIGMECRTVEGSYNGAPYSWNIICVEGVYVHVDLLRAITEKTDSLRLFTDDMMGAYSWDTEIYPPCPAAE